MKQILIFLSLIGLVNNLFAEQDKVLHATASYAINITVYSKMRSEGYNKTTSLLVSTLTSTAVGAIKEYCIDNKYDNSDMYANAMGNSVAVIIPLIWEF